MLKKMPLILSSEDLLERSFKRAKKKQITDRVPLYKKKKTIIAQTESFSTYIISSLEKYVKEFPSINELPLFYQELIDIKIDVNKLKKSLGAVDWARKTCNMIFLKQSRFLKKSGKIDFLKQKQKEIYGRISSVLKQIDNELMLLSNAQRIIRKFPEITDLPTIVIAGYPNVGKSSLLKCLSSAKPEIAQYPFTTKEIHVGHIEKKEKFIINRFQIIDTPGLLDRPLADKNEIERQAIAALDHLADLILFVIDSSETCGYSIEDQKNLLVNLEKIFLSSKIFVVENKIDFKRTNSSNLKISCKTGEGIQELIDRIFSFFDLKEIN